VAPPPRPETLAGIEPRAPGLNIYFAGAIRGGRGDADLYAGLIRHLGRFGRVLTVHVGDAALLREEKFLSEGEIFQRDMEWLRAADLMVAEVSTPSLGVGFEIAMAQALAKEIFCLYRPGTGRSLSAMITGNPGLRLHPYADPTEAMELLDDLVRSFLQTHYLRNTPPRHAD